MRHFRLVTCRQYSSCLTNPINNHTANRAGVPRPIHVLTNHTDRVVSPVVTLMLYLYQEPLSEAQIWKRRVLGT